jgi:predicted DsbA family dithiol-disulfide isomerase
MVELEDRMNRGELPELWEWGEFYCPWSYIATVRLDKIAPEYAGRVRLRERSFPLEVYGGGPPDRRELSLEIWLAAQQEPLAEFAPFSDDWPATTLPAFDGAWAAFQQGEAIGRDFDLRIRRAFFAQGRNIGRPEVIRELAREANLDLDDFTDRIESGQARAAVLEEGRLGKEVYRVRSTPTVMLSDGKKLHHPIAYPKIEDGQILAVGKLPCCNEGCYDLTRGLFEAALERAQVGNA